MVLLNTGSVFVALWTDLYSLKARMGHVRRQATKARHEIKQL